MCLLLEIQKCHVNRPLAGADPLRPCGSFDIYSLGVLWRLGGLCAGAVSHALASEKNKGFRRGF